MVDWCRTTARLALLVLAELLSKLVCLIKLNRLACVLQCAGLANSAGIGGGPFYMPLFNVVLAFGLSESTALSHAVVSISAVASSLYGLSQPSPHDERYPLVDIDIALLFMPALLMGVSIGVCPSARQTFMHALRGVLELDLAWVTPACCVAAEVCFVNLHMQTLLRLSLLRMRM